MTTLMGEPSLTAGTLLAALEPFEAERGLTITKDGGALMVPMFLMGEPWSAWATLFSSVNLTTKALKVTELRQRLVDLPAEMPIFVLPSAVMEEFPLVITGVSMRRNLVGLEVEIGWAPDR